MSNIIEKDYIIFNNRKIHIIVDDKIVIWFNANEVAAMLGYKYPKHVIFRTVKKSNKTTFGKLKKFTKNINRRSHIMYIDEVGLYELLLSSKQPRAKKFREWVTGKVLPSIRKRGHYEEIGKYQKEIGFLRKKMAVIESNREKLMRNMKSEKYPKGGTVYAIDYSEDGKSVFRIGQTMDMNKRKAIYDSHTFHKKDIVISEKTDDPLQLEKIVKELLKSKRYKNHKDFYLCDLKYLKNAFKIAKKSIDDTKKMNDQMGGECDEIKKRIKFLQKEIKKLKIIIEHL